MSYATLNDAIKADNRLSKQFAKNRVSLFRAGKWDAIDNAMTDAASEINIQRILGIAPDLAKIAQLHTQAKQAAK